MFKIVRQQEPDLFTIYCYLYQPEKETRDYLYSFKDRTLPQVTEFLTGQGDKNYEDHLEVILGSSYKFKQAYVDDKGQVLYVDPSRMDM